MSIGLELVDSNNKIMKEMLQVLAEHFNKAIIKAIPGINNKVKIMTVDHLRSTETYQALAGGKLEGHFGFYKGTGSGKAESIVSAVANGINITHKSIRVVGNKFQGDLTVSVLRKNLDEVFSLGDSILTIINRGQPLPWADWLLKRGHDIIIKQYEISWQTGHPASRSGQAVMVFDDSSFWQVPPEHAGTINDNWLTRSILRESDGYVQKLHTIIRKEVSRLI